MPATLRRLPFAVAVILLATAAGSGTPVDRLDKEMWAKRHEQKLREIRSGPVDMILLGDSITQELENRNLADIHAVWDQFYACRHAVNLGFSGDTSANLLWRIENGEVNGIHPRLALIIIGANDIRPHSGSRVQDVVDGTEAVVGELHRRLPGTAILITDVPPSGKEPAAEAQRQNVNAALGSYNWASRNASRLIIDPALETDGQLDLSRFRPSAHGPLVHPNGSGWGAMAALLEPEIDRVLGPPGPGGHCP